MLFCYNLQIRCMITAVISMSSDTCPLNQPKTMILDRIETQSLKPDEYPGKQPLVCRDLSHLKRNISAVSDNLRPDLYELNEETVK